MKKLLLCFSVFFAFVLLGLAQSNTGNLTVNVSDPSGVIPGATVVVTDNATGRERTFVTGGDGSVAIPNLDVGSYTVRVTAQGRKTGVYNDVKIEVGKTYVLNVSLELGPITDEVVVTAGNELINSATGEVSRTITAREIIELPLNGRNPLALIGLQAGTSQNGATNTVINGQRVSFTNITRDGLNVQDNFIRANATDFVPDRPNVDDVEEFTIVNQNAGAEYGYGASQVSIVTPRGGNTFTGALYIYNRNSKFAANSFFNNLNRIPRPFLNRNQFGGRIGGRVIKDRLFFFGSYEGFRLRQSASITRTTLLPQAKTGIFTYIDNSGVTRTLNVLTTAGVSPDPVIQNRIISKLPAPNNFISGGDFRNTAGYSFSQKQNQDREAITTRFDFDLNSKNTFSTIYAYRQESLLRPDVDNGGFNTTPFGFQKAKTYTTNSAWRFTPTGRMINEFRVALQLSRPFFDRTDKPTNYFLTIPLVSSPESTFERQGRNTAIWLVRDDFTYSLSRHTIRFGGHIYWFRINPFGPPAFSNSTIPTVSIGAIPGAPQLTAAQFPGGISSAQLNTANALLALLGGYVSSVAQTFNVVDKTSGYRAGVLPSRRLHYEHYSAYVSDQWRITPEFTLNLGARYEVYTPVSEPSGLAVEPVLGSNASMVNAILDPNGQYNFVGTNFGDNRFFKTDYNNLAPNVSFAWSPNFGGPLRYIFPGEGRSVIRGGFSVSFVNDEFVRSADNALNANQGLTQTVTLTQSTFVQLANFNPSVTPPTFVMPRSYAFNNNLAGNFGTVFGIDPDLQVPSLYQYHIGIQRELPWKLALEVRYVGNHSNNLVRGLDFNQVIIKENGFLADFLRARQNLLLTGNPNCFPTPGCQQLTFFPTLPNGGLLNNATIRNQILLGQPADLAIIYITNPGIFPGVSPLFLRNPNTGVADLIGNFAKSRYNSMQVELRRNFSQGIYFQFNYTLQKTLTDAAGVGQTRFDPLIDNNNRRNEYARADFDQEHVINFNTIYELPFGKGKPFLNQGGIINQIVGGWQFSAIVRFGTGAPISITDPRGTLNRAGRSGRQTAFSPLSNPEISRLIGVFRTPCGVFFINPAVININQANLASGNCGALGSGRGAEGFGSTPFPGQVFFNVAPGETGNMARNAWNGPNYYNWDASLLKNFTINERMRLQFRVEAFNVFNRTNFFVGVFPGNGNINSANFGRITSAFAPRVVQFVGRFEFK
ncbi:MAG: hypothetical protein D6687_05320 [Acidobacteria bacterium]|jgi:hypothetical protein|nr:MAG: hypothetical protein D6687_05320 [Acidobacteriota bacterium]